MIEIHGVSHAIRGAKILENISLTIPKGKITALVGPNGAGKSTLLSLMARLQTLQQGTISVDGMDVARTPSDVLARRLAILTQSNNVVARLRLRELVNFGRFPHHKGRAGKEDEALVSSALEALELDDLADRFIDELSGGQRQKAFVAMAYAQNTDYLLLDEPLNNLDMTSARSLMKRLHKLVHDEGKTVVLVVHEINYASLYADYIVGLREGRLIAAGDREDIITPHHMGEIFGMNVKIEQFEDKRLVMHY